MSRQRMDSRSLNERDGPTTGKRAMEEPQKKWCCKGKREKGKSYEYRALRDPSSFPTASIMLYCAEPRACMKELPASGHWSETQHGGTVTRPAMESGELMQEHSTKSTWAADHVPRWKECGRVEPNKVPMRLYLNSKIMWACTGWPWPF